MKAFGSLAVFLFSISLLAQTASQLGRFSVPFAKGCAPFTINVTSHDDFGVITRAYTYEPGAVQTTDTFYTYTVPGIYEISQIIGATVDGNLDTLFSIEVFDPIPPGFDYSFCNPDEVYLFVTDSLYDFYEINTVNTSVQLRTDSNLGTRLSFAPSDQRSVTIEGFYDDALDNCGFTSSTLATQELINDIFINDFEFEYVCDDEYNLTINYSSGVNTYYEVELSDDGTSFSPIYTGFLQDSSHTFSGLMINSNATELCFRVNAISICDSRTITGATFCEAFTPTSGVLENAYATYVDNDIQIVFDQNPFGRYDLDKIVENEVIKVFASISTGFVDESISPLREYSYELIFSPDCEADRQSVLISPPKIFVEELSPNRFEVTWLEPVSSFTDQLGYRFIISNADSSQTSTVDNPENPETVNITRDLDVQQKIWLSGTTGDITLNSNTVRLDYQYVVYVPGAFTPNHDGQNDLLEVFGLPTENFTMKIFSRWGEVIFETSDTDNFWNGRLKDGSIIEGAYVYQIEFLNEEGELFNQLGSFVLLKK